MSSGRTGTASCARIGPSSTSSRARCTVQPGDLDARGQRVVDRVPALERGQQRGVGVDDAVGEGVVDRLRRGWCRSRPSRSGRPRDGRGRRAPRGCTRRGRSRRRRSCARPARSATPAASAMPSAPHGRSASTTAMGRSLVEHGAQDRAAPRRQHREPTHGPNVAESPPSAASPRILAFGSSRDGLVPGVPGQGAAQRPDERDWLGHQQAQHRREGDRGQRHAAPDLLLLPLARVLLPGFSESKSAWTFTLCWLAVVLGVLMAGYVIAKPQASTCPNWATSVGAHPARRGDRGLPLHPHQADRRPEHGWGRHLGTGVSKDRKIGIFLGLLAVDRPGRRRRTSTPRRRATCPVPSGALGWLGAAPAAARLSASRHNEHHRIGPAPCGADLVVTTSGGADMTGRWQVGSRPGWGGGGTSAAAGVRARARRRRGRVRRRRCRGVHRRGRQRGSDGPRRHLHARADRGRVAGRRDAGARPDPRRLRHRARARRAPALVLRPLRGRRRGGRGRAAAAVYLLTPRRLRGAVPRGRGRRAGPSSSPARCSLFASWATIEIGDSTRAA